MTFYVYKRGIGPIYGCLPNKLVGKFDSWADANNFCNAKSESTRNFYFHMTDNPDLEGTF